eukprot:354668-Pyramimonas_sp.AAC.1
MKLSGVHLYNNGYHPCVEIQLRELREDCVGSVMWHVAETRSLPEVVKLDISACTSWLNVCHPRPSSDIWAIYGACGVRDSNMEARFFRLPSEDVAKRVFDRTCPFCFARAPPRIQSGMSRDRMS